MKILLVHYRYFISGGPERYLFNVAEALKKRGIETVSFSIKNSKNRDTEYNKYFVDNIGKSDEIFVNKYPQTLRTYFDLISREFYSYKVKKVLKKLIAKEKPDLCYLLVYKRALSPSVIDACYEMGIPIINRISDYNTVCGSASLYRGGAFCKDCFKDNDKSCWKNKCIKGNFIFSIMRYLSIKFAKFKKFDSKINSYVCTNGFMKEVMEERGYDSSKLNIVPTFFLEKSEYQEVDKTNNIKDIIKFLYIGNIDESKGIFDLIDALKIVKQKTNNFVLSIVGGLHQEDNDKMLKLISSYELDDNVVFCPFRSDGKVYEYYIDSNVTVLPARWAENLPNTLIESIYFNRPVVVPNWGSFKYTTNNDVAFKFDALSYESLAQTLLSIIQKPSLITIKSKNCPAFFKDNYAEGNHINKLIELFNKQIQ